MTCLFTSNVQRSITNVKATVATDKCKIMLMGHKVGQNINTDVFSVFLYRSAIMNINDDIC